MGLTDTVTHLIMVKADTSSARAEVQKLRGVEKQAAKDRLTELETTNRGIDAQIARWAKIGVAIGAATVAAKALHGAYKNYLEDVRLESAAAGVNVEALQKATKGLIVEDQLLAFAGKAKAGVWKLNQQEMEKVLHGALALRKTMGVELQPTIEKLTEAIGKGSTRAFKEFGIVAKDKNEVLREMDKLWKSVGGSSKMAGDDITRAGVTAADAFDQLSGAIGEVVSKLGPLVALLARGLRSLLDFGDGVSDRLAGVSSSTNSGRQSLQMTQQLRLLRAVQANPWMLGQLHGLAAGQTVMNRPEFKGFSLQDARELAPQGSDIGAQIRNLETQQAKAKGTELAKDFIDWSTPYLVQAGAFLARKTITEAVKKKTGARGGGGASGDVGDPLAAFGAIGGGAGAVGGAFDVAGRDLYLQYAEQARMQGRTTLGEDMSGLDNRGQIMNDQIAGVRAELEKAIALTKQAKGATVLEQIFGDTETINGTAIAIRTATMAVDGLTNSIAASFEAAVTGSDSAIGAFKKIAGGAVHSIGKELSVVGAKEGIYALVEAAKFNFAGAGLHAGASAAAFAGSAAAFVVAKEMGYGSGGSASKPSIGSAGGFVSNRIGGGRSEGDGERQTVIMLGKDFMMLSDLEQRRLVRQAIKQGNAGGYTAGRAR